MVHASSSRVKHPSSGRAPHIDHRRGLWYTSGVIDYAGRQHTHDGTMRTSWLCPCTSTSGTRAVAFWHRTLSESGTSFRLGPMMPSTAAVPAEVLQDRSARVGGRGAPVDFPESVPGKHSQKMLCTSSEWHRACRYRVYIQTYNTVPPGSESKATSRRYVEGERHAER